MLFEMLVTKTVPGCRTTPSVLAVGEDGDLLIGQHAKDVIGKATNSLFGQCYV